MQVKVKLTEPIWRTVGTRDLVVSLSDEAATVATVLNEIARLHPKFGEEIYGGLDENDYHYSLFVNDQIVGLARRDEVSVRDGDEIFILLPIAGGC